MRELTTFRLALAASILASTSAFSSDHLEAPLVASDQAADLADVYAFLDPGDNSRVVLAASSQGFIAPGQEGNLGAFDPDVVFRFDVETTGDAVADAFIHVAFARQASRSEPQAAHVKLRGRSRVDMDAATTVASATATEAEPPTVTTDPGSGLSFFAGLVDDPFFYDVPAVARFVGSALQGAPDPDVLSRGIDTFAGHHVRMIALSVPVDLLRGEGSVLGVGATTLRRSSVRYSATREPKRAGKYVPIDRLGVPGVATVLIPFSRKDEYNRSSPRDDAAGRFAPDIVDTLTALGTDEEHVGILASVAVAKGDYLRLDTSIANAGAQGGTTKGAGFPNGRRPTDDVIDTLLLLVTNGEITSGDHVDANDVRFRDEFPFFARK